MIITERHLRKVIREVLLTELEGSAAAEWEAAHIAADRLSSSVPRGDDNRKKKDLLDRLYSGIDILIGPELRELDLFLKDLGL